MFNIEILFQIENGEEPVFNSIGTTLVKTVAMFIGELEFGDLPIDSTLGYLFLIGNIYFYSVFLSICTSVRPNQTMTS